MTILRLGAAQLHFHPAFEGSGHLALREPLGAWEGAGLSGLRAGTEEGDSLLKQLRERIERVYVEAYRPRLEAVIRFAAGLDLDLLVLPEYAVPLALLPMVAEAAGSKLTVVAGTHTITREGVRNSGVYERLGAGITSADIGRAIAPVIRGGRVIAVQAKISRSKLEPEMKVGAAWSTVALGAAEMGVLVCIDFLKRADGDVAPLVARGIDRCAVLAVPSLTPFSSLEHFERNAEELLYGYDRPVVYANRAQEGGTRVFTVEKDAPVVLAAGRPPALPRGVEGVVAVEVHLGDGKQRYQPVVASRPLAAAVVMDAGSWGELRAAVETVLAAEDAGEALDRIEEGREVFARAAKSRELPEIARERWAYLAEGAEGTSSLEHLRALVRDVWVDGGRTHREVERGLVEGAVRVLREVEKKAPEGQKVVTVRGWLEGEVLGRYKGVAAAGEVLEGVTEGLVARAEPAPLPKPAQDGSFERWVKDPGPFPDKLLRQGFTPLEGAHRLKYTHEEGEGVFFRPRTPDVTKWGVDAEPWDQAAGLLALWGHPPAWFAKGPHNEPCFVLRDGRSIVYDVVPGTIYRTFAEQEPHEGGLPRILIDGPPEELSGNQPGARVIRQEVARLGRHEDHLRAVVDHVGLEEGRRFVQPEARSRGGRGPVFEYLRAWLVDGPSLCLLLGEFGVGKSTVARTLASRIANDALDREARPVVFVNLRDWSGPAEIAGLVRRALGMKDADNLAPVRFAIEEGGCVLVLDGFDEMSNRLTPAELADALRAVLAWRTERSRILVTCRTHLFIDVADLNRVFAEATGAPLKTPGLGEIEGATVLELQLFDKERIQAYLARVTSEPDSAWEAMGKVHDLRNLAERPMLLDLIRQTLPELTRSEKVVLGDVYEMYVQKWAEWPGTDEWLDPSQKIAFAEELALCIWNDGPQVKDGAVRVDQLSGILFRDKPFDWIRRLDNDAVRLELRAGTFLVWKDGGEHGYYHFAHRSFLEYMLARRTVRDLSEGSGDVLDLPRFSPEVVEYCKARPGWETVQRKAAVILVEPYRKRVSENALLLVAGEEGIASSVERPWRLEGAELQQVSLRAARLAGAWLEKTNLTDAVLAGADLHGARLNGAVLDGADLGRADLREAGMREAKARGAILDGTRFQGADLRKSRLEGSSAFSEAPVLRGARLEGACIAGAAWREPVRGVELCGLTGIEEARWRAEEPMGPASDALAASRVEPAWHRGDVNGVAFCPDGSKLATACSNRTVLIWEVTTGRLLQTLEGHEERVTSVVWTASGKHLVTGSDDRTARIWDARTGRSLQTFKGHTQRVTSVDWTANGERLVTGSDDRTARVWDARTGDLLRTLEGHTSPINSVAWRADGELIATGSDDATAQVWEGETGRPLRTLKGHMNPVSSVAWSRDGERLATGSYDDAVFVWEVQTGRRLLSLEEHTGPVTSMAWTADGGRLATGSWDRTVRVWDASTERSLRTLEGHSKEVTSVAWTADGQRLASGSYDDTVRVWDASTGRVLQTLRGKSNIVTSVAWATDGERLATGSYDASARVWDARTGRVLQALQGHTSYVTSVAWTADGERLATGSWDKTARVWGARTGELLQTLTGHTSYVTSVAWAADGERLATGSWDKTARVWDAQTGSLLQTLKGHTDTVNSVTWEADGERLATGSLDRTARVWEVRTGHLLQNLEGHTGAIASVSWHATEDRVATGSRDGSVRVWESSTGRLLQTLKGGPNGISSIAWAADGERLAAGSSESVYVWEVNTSRLLQTLKGRGRSVTAVAWNVAGDRLATGSSNATARIWSVETAQELVVLLHPVKGGVAFSGIHALPTADIDTSTLVLCTDTECAPLALYADLCLRPNLVAEALAGNPAPLLHVPMDTAARSVAASAHEALVPSELGTLSPIKAGLKNTLPAPWTIPAELASLHGFHLTLKALVPETPIELPVDSTSTTIDFPALPPGTHQLLLTLHLGDRYERSFTFPLTVLAQNPYIAGPPVRGADLHGREADLARIRARMKNGSIRLAGERRIGKTSILHHFFDHPGPGFVPIWLDAQTLENPAAFRGWILSALRARFADAPASQSDLFVFLRTRAAAGQVPLLLIDEVIHLRGLSVRDAGLLRSLSVTPFVSILAGSPSDWSQFFASLPQDAGSPFNTLQDVSLGPLTEAQMRGLVIQAGVAPPDEATMFWILGMCGGRPYLAQRLCEAALDRTYAEKRMRMELADVEAVARETLVTGLAHQHEKRWDELASTPAAQSALVAYVLESAPAPRSLHDTLREHGLFDGLAWTVDPAFMMWIREREAT